MSVVELLQQIGLNKYEAEAYYTLLAQGPLTGYELGKRSQVPLSRSYEILERLAQKGLVLVQPGDPPYYAAEEAERLLGQVRSTMTATLDTLAVAHLDGRSNPPSIRARHQSKRVPAAIVNGSPSICHPPMHPSNSPNGFSRVEAPRRGESYGHLSIAPFLTGSHIGPASMRATFAPACVSTYAAMPPPAPEPMIATSKTGRLG